MASLDGKVALVTGASRGIGRAIALELARAGARVALNYRSGKTEARAVAEEIAAFRSGWAVAHGNGERHRQMSSADASVRQETLVPPHRDAGARELDSLEETVMLAPADVSKCDEARGLVRQVVDHWGRLDILVNNAGITRDRTLRKLGDEDWSAVISTNLNGAFYTTSAAIQIMMEQKFGRIVNIASLIGQTGNIGQANYAAAKGGMIAFTKSASLELARFNITVNAVCPGFTATDMFNNVSEEIQDQIKAKIPLGRFAKPEEIAKAVLFVVVDGDYITGQQINVNGGLYS